MGSYDDYKRGRDLAWEMLIKCGISSLPVALDKVAALCGITITSFKKAKEEGLISERAMKGRVSVGIVNGRKTVFVNTDTEDKGSIRFSMAKGIGLWLLRSGEAQDRKAVEYEAGIFARDLLMPAVVLYGLGVKSADEIEKICAVSHRAAEIRAERMAELYDRRRFNTHLLEQKVWKLFEEYIEENTLKK